MKTIGSTSAVLAAILAGVLHTEATKQPYLPPELEHKVLAITKPKARKGNKYADTRNYK